MSDPDLGAPELVVGAWRGYRIWRVAGDRLTGCWYTSYAWVPEGSEASCCAKRWTRRGRRARHPGLAAPQRDCRCGLYALQEPWDFAGYPPTSLFRVAEESNVVIGVVAGWGRAFRGQYGWRTQFARPVALYRPPHLDGQQLERIARRYGCHVVEGRSDLLTRLTSAPEPPAVPEPRQPPAYGRRPGGVPRSAVHTRFGPRCRAGRVVFMTETGKSNYPVRTPMGAQLTEEVVREIAKLLETRGFPPFTDEDIGRLHLLLYDLLYEGHEDTMRLQ